MNETQRLQPVPRLYPQPHPMARAGQVPGEFRQQIGSTIKRLEVEEAKESELYDMPLRDVATMLQKLANAEYVQRVMALKMGEREAGAKKQKDPAAPEPVGDKKSRKLEWKAGFRGNKFETVDVDKSRFKRRKLSPSENPAEASKTKQFLVTREIGELESLAASLDRAADATEALAHFKYVLKQNTELVASTWVEGATELKLMDQMLLSLILDKFKAHMYVLISHWLYQEYNLHISRHSQVCFVRYGYIINDFCNAVETKSTDELAKSMDSWYTFVWTLPLITERILQHVYAMCIKDDSKSISEVPLRLLKDLVLSPAHKENVSQKALEKLLQLTTYQKDAVKLKAIKLLAPELYNMPKYKEPITKFAVESFTRLVELNGDEDENTIKCYFGLMLRIAADEPAILVPVMQHFAGLKGNCRTVFLLKCKQLFEKCLPPTKAKVQELFEAATPEGAPVLQVYVDTFKNTSFPGPLKQSLISLAKRLDKYELVQPLIPQISQIEIDRNELLEWVGRSKFEGKREFIHGLVLNISKSTDYCNKLKKILARFHTCESTLNFGAKLVESIDICIDRKDLFELGDVVFPALYELAQMDQVSYLLPRTLLKVSIVYPHAVAECLKIIGQLLEKKKVEGRAELEYGLVQYLKKFAEAVKANMSVFPETSWDWVRHAAEDERK